MERRKVERLIREQEFVLEVEVEEVNGMGDDPWSPAYSAADAQRLFEATQAMRSRDWQRARSYGALYRLEPVVAA